MISFFDKKQLINRIMIMIKKLRQIVLIIWIFSIVYLGIWLSFHQEFLEPKNLLIFFRSFGSAALIIYILASFIRWLLLLPSLPLVVVWILFFPDNPHIVFMISMLGIIFSWILIYKFSDVMWFDEMFAKHATNTKIKEAIDTYWFYTVMIWSFAPVVPTDLICYVAGTVRMNFWKFVLALSIGEGLIVAAIIYGGVGILTILWV